MCLDHALPASVVSALDRYRGIVAEHGPNWTESSYSFYGPLVHYLRFVEGPELFAPAVIEGLKRGVDLAASVEAAFDAGLDTAFRDALKGQVPDGLIALRLRPEGWSGETSGIVHPVLAGEKLPVLLLADSSLDRDVQLDGFGTVRAGQGAVWPLEIGAEPFSVTADGTDVVFPPIAATADTARLRLRASRCSRWSVLSDTGHAWFPEDALRKWDAYGRGYFHGEDVVLDVPAQELTVLVARGMDFGVERRTVTPKPGEDLEVRLDPPRLREPAADGWYGADLHLHLHFAGDLVCSPLQAGRMQHGEALPLMHPLAANATTSFVFDREMFTEWLGRDLPWSTPDMLARMGAEYRNDLLGHIAAFGLTSEPPLYYTGHAESDTPTDRAPNAHLCAELKERGALITWAHPLGNDADDPLDAMFGMPRSTECRELVADAALGLVDGLDVLTHLSCTGTAKIYRRLLGAGVHLAVTAGTDVMLSYSRLSVYSNPPGWARVYARLNGPLTVENYQEAVRSCRTFATNGPWLTLDVSGQGPGATIDAEPGQWLAVRAETPADHTIRIYDAEGVIAEGKGHVDLAYDVRYPTYLVAELEGVPHPDNLDPKGPYAHTSPVQVTVAGRSVAREEDLTWCLAWLDRLEALVRAQGADPTPDLFSVLDQARAIYRARLPHPSP